MCGEGGGHCTGKDRDSIKNGERREKDSVSMGMLGTICFLLWENGRVKGGLSMVLGLCFY